jgi:hypothetical protein
VRKADAKQVPEGPVVVSEQNANGSRVVLGAVKHGTCRAPSDLGY